MKKITKWIVKKTIRNHKNYKDPKVRLRYGRLEGWTSIIINLVLFMFKLVIGMAIRSIALIADAMHTLFDSVTSIVVIVGFKAAEKPSDRMHPFGHGRVESVATLIIAVLLFITGFEMLKGSIKAISSPSVMKVDTYIIVLISVSLVIKELLARFSRQLGIMIDSKTLIADFLHHRSDVFATLLVIVGLVISNYGFTSLDGVMGILVSIIIAYSGYSIGREAISPLMGEGPSLKDVKGIKATALKISDVQGIHDIICHEYGQTKLCSLHVEVSGKLDPVKMHRIAEEVEQKVAGEINGTVIVHIDPINKNHHLYGEIQKSLDEIISASNDIVSWHELRISGKQDGIKAIFDIVLRDDIKEKDIRKTKKYILEKLREKHDTIEVTINVDPKYVYNP